jgi:hypothetical protein
MSYIITSTGEQFKPEGISGELQEGATDKQAESILFYRSFITGAQGARYELLKESHHTEEDVNGAKQYLRRNFDTVSIHILTAKA